MKKTGRFHRLAISCAAAIAAAAPMLQAATFVHQNSNRVTIKLNRSWWFIGSDGSYSGTTLNDSTGSWTKVCLPQQNITVKHMFFNGGDAHGSGAVWQFNSWYRKHYNIPSTYSGRRFFLEFEGVSTIATVYVNGTQVGTHSGGYTPFTIDITGQVVTGAGNVIAVQVNSQYQSGIPPETGSNIDYCVFGGIVRNVNLIITDPLHVEWNWVSIPNATSSTSTPTGTVTSHVKLVNNATASKSYTLTTSIVDNTNNVVASGSASGTIAAGASTVITYVTTSGAVANFWSPDNPYLYTVYTQVVDVPNYVDEFVDRTGFRTIWPLTKGTNYGGISINGTNIKLFGLSRHETFPFFGRAAAARLQRKDADILKYELGCNLARCSHYTQAPDFLKRCDEIGLMVIQEVPGWMYLGSSAWQTLLQTDLKEMIYRDRNRPSVISFGVRVNESPDNATLYQAMNDTARAIDPSRPTHGVRKSDGSTSEFREDWWCRNFADPGSGGPFPWITSETVGHTLTPQVHSWDNDVSQMTQASAHVTEQNNSYGNTYSTGKLGWCAFDYNSPHANATTNEIGGRITTSPYLSPHGVASIFRLPKLAGYFFRSQRNPATCGYTVTIANDWLSSSPTTVTVFSNCPYVELIRNGTSLGRIAGNLGTNLPHPAFQWSTTIASGTLVANGYSAASGGSVLATDHVSTPSTPTALVLTPDTNVIYDGGDMTRVVVSYVDSSRRAVRSRADSISMSASGAGDFIGEARSALEGGQFAFYVKSRDGVTGTINCTAGIIGGSITGTTTITVIGDPTVGVIDNNKSLTGGVLSPRRTTYRTMTGRFTVPAWVSTGSSIAVYDLAGKLLFRTAVRGAKVVDLGKAAKTTNAVYIIKIEGEKR
jgi:beta-galactosidase